MTIRRPVAALALAAALAGCTATNSSSTPTASATPASDPPANPSAPPHLEKRDGMTKLIVDGQPYICVAGELRNDSSSDPQGIKETFPRLAAAHLNTLLSVVSWDLVEPTEGHFDFSMVDNQLAAARESHVHLILLWMGSWKNGLSHYPPEWVKADQARFPRVVNADGNSLEILSTLAPASRDADAAAFAAVMRHLRQVDGTQHTVIAMQVENEVGVLGSTRDFSPAANAAFNGPVPHQLMTYLTAHESTLRPELKALWDAAGHKTSGTWEQVFGKNNARPADMPPQPNSPSRTARPADATLYDHTNELFMAWNYAQYIGHVAAEGKREYNIPMYINTWIVQPNDIGAGDYPSGGGEPLDHDIWHAGAPAIDILAPDIYLTPYAPILQNWARNGNPAFNPETRQDSQTCWTAFTQLNALCFSPFGIDNLSPNSGYARTCGFISSLSGAIAEAQGQPDAIKLIQLQPGQNPGKVSVGDYTFDFTPPPNGGRRGGRGGGRGGAAASQSSEEPSEQAGSGGPANSPALSFLNSPFLLIIHTAPKEYYFATNSSLPFIVQDNSPNLTATAASIDIGSFVAGQWVTTRRLNGDDIMGRGYDISAAAARHQSGTQVPLGARGGFGQQAAEPPITVERVRLYTYH